MFREMRRWKQQLDKTECIAILKSTKRGVLSLIGDSGYPYALPINHWYCETDNKIYFHGAKEGHKIDAIKACDKACFCVYDEGYQKLGEWALNIKSVIVFGKIRLLDNTEKSKLICSEITRKFTDDQAYLEKELNSSLSRVQCLELTLEHISGKLVNES